MIINAGELNKRITIQKRNKQVDNNGFEVDTWEDFKNIWAKIKNNNGKESTEAQGEKNIINKKIITRYFNFLDSSINTSVSIDYRVKYKGNIYNIRYSDNYKEESRYLDIMIESSC